jgi:SET domain-containing protein
MLNKKIIKKKKSDNQFGLFALEPVARGEFVWEPHHEDPGQPIKLSLDEARNLPDEQRRIFYHFSYQIDDNTLSGYFSSGDADLDPANFMNHSCDPNCWYSDGVRLVARRDIAPGEEITYDYATDATAKEWGFDCKCGAVNCRGKLKRDDWVHLKDIYHDHFIEYIRKKL